MNIVYDGEVKLIEDLNTFNAASSVEIPAEIRDQLEPEEVIDPNVEQSEGYSFYSDATVKNTELNKKKINKNK